MAFHPNLPIFDHKWVALPIWLPDLSGENESVLDLCWLSWNFPRRVQQTGAIMDECGAQLARICKNGVELPDYQGRGCFQ